VFGYMKAAAKVVGEVTKPIGASYQRFNFVRCATAERATCLLEKGRESLD
jgi:hypothetical protein